MTEVLRKLQTQAAQEAEALARRRQHEQQKAVEQALAEHGKAVEYLTGLFGCAVSDLQPTPNLRGELWLRLPVEVGPLRGVSVKLGPTTWGSYTVRWDIGHFSAHQSIREDAPATGWKAFLAQVTSPEAVQAAAAWVAEQMFREWKEAHSAELEALTDEGEVDAWLEGQEVHALIQERVAQAVEARKEAIRKAREQERRHRRAEELAAKVEALQGRLAQSQGPEEWRAILEEAQALREGYREAMYLDSWRSLTSVLEAVEDQLERHEQRLARQRLEAEADALFHPFRVYRLDHAVPADRGDEDGEVWHTGTEIALDDTPDERGYYRVLESGRVRRVKLPRVYRVEVIDVLTRHQATSRDIIRMACKYEYADGVYLIHPPEGAERL
ncbi:hypothetical protein [Calidithermus chliarophilus]|uniref:hypothetical protein n=1 Tax=Calidithermus chliarophilus TaxID=52023 RepID=UPI0003FF9A2E|nr:hypothetical protein [Calidithermus chliarophilus]